MVCLVVTLSGVPGVDESARANLGTLEGPPRMIPVLPTGLGADVVPTIDRCK